MPQMKDLAVKDLSLDLTNYRTVRQTTEIAAIEAMISTRPDKFWALMESLLTDGYLPTENIIVLKSSSGESIVKEGNRRVAALKIMLGLVPTTGLGMPADVSEQLKRMASIRRMDTTNVPCTIYGVDEGAIVDRIVTLAHGKGEKAGRDQWNAVARARHNRDASKQSEPALDLLEKYLNHGKNLTAHQKTKWAGVYPLSVLDEAIKRVAQRLGATSAPDLAKAYPNINHRPALESILHDIGAESLGFDRLRATEDFASSYGIAGGGSAGRPKKSKGAKQGKAAKAPRGVPSKPVAYSINDPRAVRRLLKNLVPRGNGRDKVVTLRNEAIALNIAKTPLAFCFVLRSMIEISAKAYAKDHVIATTRSAGKEKTLVELLRDIVAHLTKNQSDKDMLKALHGAMSELAKNDGLLSVTSMNQLIHNPRFAVTAGDIASVFGNVFPIVEWMNA